MTDMLRTEVGFRRGFSVFDEGRGLCVRDRFFVDAEILIILYQLSILSSWVEYNARIEMVLCVVKVSLTYLIVSTPPLKASPSFDP